MNEVEYMLRRDMREKKAAGRGIYHRRNGSRTKHVSLPHDHMTEAQWKRRNSPVQTYNISRVIRSYDEFKSLPKDLAEEYLSRLRTTYNAGGPDVAKSMGVHPTTFNRYIRENDIKSPFSKGNHGHVDFHWSQFLREELNSAGERIAEPVPVPEEPVAPAPEPTPDPEPAAANTKVVPVNFRFIAEGTPEQLLDFLMNIFADMTNATSKYELIITMDRKGDDAS